MTSLVIVTGQGNSWPEVLDNATERLNAKLQEWYNAGLTMSAKDVMLEMTECTKDQDGSVTQMTFSMRVKHTRKECITDLRKLPEIQLCPGYWNTNQTRRKTPKGMTADQTLQFKKQGRIIARALICRRS